MGSVREHLLPQGGGVVSLVGAGGKTTLMFHLARELAEDGARVLTTSTTKILKPSKDQSAKIIVSADARTVIKKSEGYLSVYPHVTAARSDLAPEGKLIGFEPSAIEQIWETELFGWILVEADGAGGRPLKAPEDHEPVIPACSAVVVGVVGLDGVGRRLEEEDVFRSKGFSRISGLPLGAPVTEVSIARMIEHEEGLFKRSPPKATRCVFLNKADEDQSRRAAQRIASILHESATGRVEKILIGSLRNDPPTVEAYFPKAGSWRSVKGS
jgi:probable selenium-dependent hydroxylase accessory protein YqeC